MDYREFVDQVTKDLKEVLSDEFQAATVTARQVDKLLGESYYGICVQPEGSNIGVTMNVQGSYEKYQRALQSDIVRQSDTIYGECCRTGL